MLDWCGIDHVVSKDEDVDRVQPKAGPNDIEECASDPAFTTASVRESVSLCYAAFFSCPRM